MTARDRLVVDDLTIKIATESPHYEVMIS